MNNLKKIISFSLWGDESKYCVGAIRNTQLQKLVYPDWVCRFYLDPNTVPHAVINQLDDLGCEIKLRKNAYFGKYAAGKFWRHSVMTDPEVERFIVRDTDSRIGLREKQCVDEWIESGKSLHIMRDHSHHGHRMMGGMWGGVREQFDKINYHDCLTTFLSAHNFTWKKKRQMDQRFLEQIIYPEFTGDVFIHDNRHFFKDEQVHSIPKDGKHFIGEIVDVI